MFSIHFSPRLFKKPPAKTSIKIAVIELKSVKTLPYPARVSAKFIL
jgi:hypothetical protein